MCVGLYSGFKGGGGEIELAPEALTTYNDLMTLCSSLDVFDLNEWDNHTRSMWEASQVTQVIKTLNHPPEMPTNAFLKMYEMLMSEPIIPERCYDDLKLTTLHLCELPGAFVTAFNHYLKVGTRRSTMLENFDNEESPSSRITQWRWYATSLNPHFESCDPSVFLSNDTLSNHTFDSWVWGPDDSGDILKDPVQQKIRGLEVKCDVITADGSFCVQHDPAQQEKMVLPLQIAETVVALSMLKDGGTFVLKVYTLFTEQAIQLMALLSAHFETIRVVKPKTSKPGNSERYLIGLNFTRQSKMLPLYLAKARFSNHPPQRGLLFPRTWVPAEFRAAVLAMNETFVGFQRETIQMNINAMEVIQRGGRAQSRDAYDNPRRKREDAGKFIAQLKLGDIREDQLLVHRSYYTVAVPRNPPALNDLETRRRLHQQVLDLTKERREVFHKFPGGRVFQLELMPTSDEPEFRSVRLNILPMTLVMGAENDSKLRSLKGHRGQPNSTLRVGPYSFKNSIFVGDAILSRITNLRFRANTVVGVANGRDALHFPRALTWRGEQGAIQLPRGPDVDMFLALWQLQRQDSKMTRITSQELTKGIQSMYEKYAVSFEVSSDPAFGLSHFVETKLGKPTCRVFVPPPPIKGTQNDQGIARPTVNRPGLFYFKLDVDGLKAGSLSKYAAAVKNLPVEKHRQEQNARFQHLYGSLCHLSGLQTSKDPPPDADHVQSLESRWKSSQGSAFYNIANLAVCDPHAGEPIFVEPVQTELVSFSSLCLALTLAIRSLRVGGDLILRLSSAYCRPVNGILAMLALAFDRISICRPPTTPDWTGVKFILCSRLYDRDVMKTFTSTILFKDWMNHATGRTKMVSRTVHPKLYCYPPFLSYIVKVNNILDNQSMTDFSKRAASDATFCRTEEEVSEAAAKLLRRLQLLNLLTGDECGAELISNLADLVRKDCDDDDDEEEFVPQSEGCGWGEQNADLIPELLKRVSPQEPLNTTKKRKRKEIEHPAGDPPTAPDQDTVRVHVLHASLSMPI